MHKYNKTFESIMLDSENQWSIGQSYRPNIESKN